MIYYFRVAIRYPYPFYDSSIYNFIGDSDWYYVDPLYTKYNHDIDLDASFILK